MTKRPTESDHWSSDSEALFRFAKMEHAPSAVDRERVRQALSQKLAAVGNASAAGDDTALGGATRTGATGTVQSGLVMVGFAVALVATGMFAVLRTGDSATRAESAPAPDFAYDTLKPAHSATPAWPAAFDSAPAETLTSNQPAAARAPRLAREHAPTGEASRSARAPVETTPAAAPTPHPADFRASDGATAAGYTAHAVELRANDAATTAGHTPRAVDLGPTATGSSARAASDFSSTHRAASVGGATSTRADARESDVAKAARTSVGARAPLAVPYPAPTRTIERAAASSAPNLSDARAELALVMQIQAALRRVEPATALALCAEHARRWPDGVFEQEREGLHAIAACQSAASRPDARARARAYFATYPRGPLVPRVREACASQLATELRL